MLQSASITFGQVLLTVLELAVLAAWIWVAVSVIMDVFRSPDLSSAAKAGWIFVIVLIPILGVMIYVIARGDKMKEHELVADIEDRGAAADDELRRVQKSVGDTAGQRRRERTPTANTQS